MRFRKIIRHFENGNVSVCGLRGRGKDMLMSNVVVRRKAPYISNVPYGGEHFPLDFVKLNCGKNIYRNFISGKVNHYEFPYPDGTDVYISDAGVYFPSQYCSDLNREFKDFPTFMSLSRHVGQCNVHYNAQTCNRVWDKLREQSDTYILCNWCIVVLGFVVQKVTIYDNYNACLERQKPFGMRTSLFDRNQSKTAIRLAREQFRATHGDIRSGILFYKNKSNYNTRYFKELMSK